MQLKLVKSATTYYSGVDVEHNGKTLKFKAKGKVHCGTNEPDLFDCFNAYVETMDEMRLDKLFDCFKRAKMILEPSYEPNAPAPSDELLTGSLDYKYLIKLLKPIMAEAFDLLKPTNFEYFIMQSGFVDPPADLDTYYSKGEYPPETTFNPA